MNSTLKEFAKILKVNINLPAFFAMCINTNKNLNGPCNRFQKGTLREKGLAIYSNGRFEWVDEEGRDNRDRVTNADIEWKTTALLTKTGRTKRYVEARIKNTMGNSDICTVKNPADFYLFGGQDGIVMCDYTLLEQYLNKTKDCIVCKVPFDKMTVVSMSKDYEEEIKKIQEKTREVDYIKKRDEMLDNFLKEFI